MTDESTDVGATTQARRATAEAMAARQREISVSEFFTKNRHLLGFDNPAKALLTTVKEAVDNALDACEEAGILPSIEVTIEETGEGRYRVKVEDNGPGIVKAQIPKIFAKLLYGSKFHRLRQSRGQQGIGISAAGMYGQLTTGRPVVITSKIGRGRPAYRLEVRIDGRTNNPDVLRDEVVPWEKEHGTAVEIELTGLYRGGRTSVDAYLEQTVVANPHLELTYQAPRGDRVHFPRVSTELPPEAHEIKPHPHGVELGMLIKILQEAGERSVRTTLMEEFSRVTSAVANEICHHARVDPHERASALAAPKIEAMHAVMVSSHATLPQPRKFALKIARSEKSLRDAILEEGSGFTSTFADELLRRAHVEAGTRAKLATPKTLQRLYDTLDDIQVKILPPPATCVVPVGETLILEGLKRRFKGEYFVAHTRPPAVYRGNPFVVEVGLAFGGGLSREDPAEVLRFANRVPLLYQPRACGVTEAVLKIDWKSYGLLQRKGEVPVGPLAVFVHLASVWVPFTSEAKEAVAHYDEIIQEIRLALMECGRKLGSWVRAQEAERWEAERKQLFEKYIEELATSISELTKVPREKIEEDFQNALPLHVRLPKPVVEAAPADGATDGDGDGGDDVPAGLEATDASAHREEPAPAKPAARRKKPLDDEPATEGGDGDEVDVSGLPLWARPVRSERGKKAPAPSVDDDDDAPLPPPVRRPAPKSASAPREGRVPAATKPAPKPAPKPVTKPAAAKPVAKTTPAKAAPAKKAPAKKAPAKKASAKKAPAKAAKAAPKVKRKG